MKKRTYIKFKHKSVHDLLFSMTLNGLMKEYEEQIKTGEIQLDWSDWNEVTKSSITMDMDSTPENIKRWTATGFRDKLFNKTLSPFLSIENITLEGDKAR